MAAVAAVAMGTGRAVAEEAVGSARAAEVTAGQMADQEAAPL